MFLGVYNKGDKVPLRVQTLDSDEAPITSSAAVTAKIYDAAAALVTTIYLSPLDRFDANPCVFGHYWRPDVAGSFAVVYTWSVAGSPRVETSTFQVRDAGNSLGAIRSMHNFVGPGFTGLVYQTENGAVYFGRNPR